MGRASLLFLSVSLAAAGALLLNANGCGGGSTAVPPPLVKIQHVIVIVQENRTPDNLFHDPVLIARGADIASSGLDSSGNQVPLTPTPLGINYDLGHSHGDFVVMCDLNPVTGVCKMDGAQYTAIVCDVGSCPASYPQFKYVQASDVGPYFQMAEQYTFGDRMFQTNQGPSFPAHQFILSGTSAPSASSNLFAAENPSGGAGCAAPPASYVTLIDPSGGESSSTYPCFEHATLSDELDAKGLSWHYERLNLDCPQRHPAPVRTECPSSQRHQVRGAGLAQ
jgi:phospholipase C